MWRFNEERTCSMMQSELADTAKAIAGPSEIGKAAVRRPLGGTMSYPRIYNAAVDMVDRNVAQGRGAKPAFIDAHARR